MTDSVAQIIALASILGAIGVIGAAVRGVWRWGRRVNQHFDDLMGEPPRPGFEARPGVLERLKGIDVALDSLGARIGVVEQDTAQLRRNGGTHLADAVHEQQRLQAAHGQILARIEATLSALTAASTQPIPAVERPEAA